MCAVTGGETTARYRCPALLAGWTLYVVVQMH